MPVIRRHLKPAWATAPRAVAPSASRRSSGSASVEERLRSLEGKGVDGLGFDRHRCATIGWDEWRHRFLVDDASYGDGDFHGDRQLPRDVDPSLCWTERDHGGYPVVISGLHGGSSTWWFHVGRVPVPEGFQVAVRSWSTEEDRTFLRGAIFRWQRDTGMPGHLLITEEFQRWFAAAHPERRDLVDDYFGELAVAHLGGLRVYGSRAEFARARW